MLDALISGSTIGKRRERGREKRKAEGKNV